MNPTAARWTNQAIEWLSGTLPAWSTVDLRSAVGPGSGSVRLRWRAPRGRSVASGIPRPDRWPTKILLLQVNRYPAGVAQSVRAAES
jgi:hypothetical protein